MSAACERWGVGGCGGAFCSEPVSSGLSASLADLLWDRGEIQDASLHKTSLLLFFSHKSLVDK